MAKLLGLKLKYQDKFLSYVTEKRDFGKKFLIGSDPNLFWQILDSRFPKQHILISKHGNTFKLHLRQGMNLSVQRGDETLSMEELKQRKLIRGNDLILSEDTRGTITLGKDWEIEYAFSKPYAHVPTQAERALIAQFSRRPPSSAEQKFTSVFLLLAILVTVIGIIIFQTMKPEPTQKRSLVELYQAREMAQLVQTDAMVAEDATGTEEDYSQRDVAAEREASAADAEQVVAEAAQVSAGMISEDLGFEFDPNAVPQGGIAGTDIGADAILQVNQASSIVSTGGSGRSLASNEAAAMFDARAAGGAQALEGAGDIGGMLATDAIGVGGGGMALEAVDIGQIAGSGGSFQVVQLTSNAQFQSIRASRYGGIARVSQEELDILPPTDPQRTEFANIKTYISTYQTQVENAFRIESAVSPMHGTLEITLLIQAGGKVDGVELSTVPGSQFSQGFLSKVEDICMAWKIPVSKNTIYSWRMQFMQ
ncbi:MAG: hypothetical protein K8R90_04755 [Candidatus Cloacimonetes bacterium]|nr:hypothetical protein [Candidatus Cloacimonadota bacterium]